MKAQNKESFPDEKRLSYMNEHPNLLEAVPAIHNSELTCSVGNRMLL
jgi:hypothetical protein